MTALAAGLARPQMSGAGVFPASFKRLVAADAVCYQGGIACKKTTGGYITPAVAGVEETPALQVIGVFGESVDNTGGDDGDLLVTVKTGVFRFANSSGGDEIDVSNIGSDCYAADDNTVSLTADQAGDPLVDQRVRAGKIINVDTRGVWVLVGPGL